MLRMRPAPGWRESVTFSLFLSSFRGLRCRCAARTASIVRRLWGNQCSGRCGFLGFFGLIGLVGLLVLLHRDVMGRIVNHLNCVRDTLFTFGRNLRLGADVG